MNLQASRQGTLPLVAGGVLSGAIFMALITLSSSASSALAQVTTTDLAPPQTIGRPVASARPAATSAAPARIEARPYWKDLTAEQQHALKPLAWKWSSMSVVRKRKWLEMSKNYFSMPPTEQAKLHSRMTEWASLSPQQRDQARLNFAQTKELTPAQKAATWQAYQALSPEERQKLAAKAPRKPSGVATAIKPAPPDKLAVVPVSRQTAKHPQKLAGSTHALDQHTLLPQQAPAIDPATVQKH